jgi:DNA polymerase eta
MSLDDPVPKPTHLDWDTLLKPSQSNIIPLDSDSCDADTWTDIALLIGAELMAQCRQQVFDQLGYTCSAGIATNKVNPDL